MYINFAGRFNAAFGFVPGSVVGLTVDQFLPLNVQVYMQNEGSFDEVALYQRPEEKYLFAFRTLAEDYKNVFATPPMLSLHKAKRLIVTTVDNSDIEVVERYGTEPYEITWRGLLIDMVNHKFPLDKLEELNTIFSVNAEWNVSSEILNKVGIEAVYIKDFNIEFVEGYEDTISYTFTMRAIRPLEYQLINA